MTTYYPFGEHHSFSSDDDGFCTLYCQGEEVYRGRHLDVMEEARRRERDLVAERELASLEQRYSDLDLEAR